MHVGVIIQMVAREVGKHGDVERHSGDALLVQRMRRHLQTHAGGARVQKLPEQTMDCDHIGCRVVHALERIRETAA
jgi:hypothetical protein